MCLLLLQAFHIGIVIQKTVELFLLPVSVLQDLRYGPAVLCLQPVDQIQSVGDLTVLLFIVGEGIHVAAQRPCEVTAHVLDLDQDAAQFFQSLVKICNL